MIKAKEFFKVLCDELNYRFFAGVPCKGLAALYANMKDSFILYVPAVNEITALGLAAGAAVSGLGSGIFIDLNLKENIYSTFGFVLDNKLPLLVVGYSDQDKENFKYDIPSVRLKKVSDITKLVHEIEEKLSPGLLIIGKDVIK